MHAASVGARYRSPSVKPQSKREIQVLGICEQMRIEAACPLPGLPSVGSGAAAGPEKPPRLIRWPPVAQAIKCQQGAIDLDAESVDHLAGSRLQRQSRDHADARVIEWCNQQLEKLRLDVHVVVGQHDHFAAAHRGELVHRLTETEILSRGDEAHLRVPGSDGVGYAVPVPRIVDQIERMLDGLLPEMCQAGQHHLSRRGDDQNVDRSWGRHSGATFSWTPDAGALGVDSDRLASIDPGYTAARMSSRRALVTGAAGFIGSHVVDSCLELGLDVVATDDLSGGFYENVSAGAEWMQGNLRDAEFVKSLWDGRHFDYVYHIGAYAAEGLSHFIRAYNYRTNLEAGVLLINQSVLDGVERFVFTSSIAVYGGGQAPMTEEQLPQPEDPYGISKYAVELDLRAAHEMFGLDYTIFRPHNVYGERQNIADRYRNVIGIFMNSVLQGEPMPVFGDGTQMRAFSHIADVAPLIARAPLVDQSRNEVFNIGADQPYTILELAHEIADAFGVAPNVRHLPARNEVVHAFSAGFVSSTSPFGGPQALVSPTPSVGGRGSGRSRT